MANLPFKKVEDSFYEFLRSGRDKDKTVDWMVARFGDEPVFTKAKSSPRKIALNIITFGRTEESNDRCIQAFDAAFSRYMAEELAHQEERFRGQLREQANLINQLRDALSAKDQELGEQRIRIQRLEDERVDLTRQNGNLHLQAALGAGVDSA